MRRSEKTRQRGSGASEKRREKREARRREQSGVAFARVKPRKSTSSERHGAASVGEKLLPGRLADPGSSQTGRANQRPWVKEISRSSHGAGGAGIKIVLSGARTALCRGRPPRPNRSPRAPRAGRGCRPSRPARPRSRASGAAPSRLAAARAPCVPRAASRFARRLPPKTRTTPRGRRRTTISRPPSSSPRTRRGSPRSRSRCCTRRTPWRKWRRCSWTGSVPGCA